MAPRSRKSEQRARPKRVAEPAGFKSLSKADQVRYLQKLWDSIADGPGQLPVPTAHLSLAKERLAAYRRDPTRSRSAYEVIRDLAKPDR
jgi:putative addiction module component (TIGR02574 family)